MKALGAGAALGALGWSTLGAGGGDTGGTSTVTDLDEHTGTVHDVQTLISGPPSNPDRPADFFYEPTGLHVAPGDVVRWTFTTPDHNVVGIHPAFGMRRRVPLGVDAFSSPLMGFRPDTIPGDMVEPPAPPAEEGGSDGNETTGTVTGTMTETTGTGTTGTETGTTMTGTTDGGDGGAMPAGPVPDTWLLSLQTPGVYDIICSPHEGFGMAMRIVVGDETTAPFETSDPEALPEPRAGPVGLSRVTLTDPALQPETVVERGTVSWSDLESVGGEDEGDDDGDDEGDGTEAGTGTTGTEAGGTTY
ncbi:hypothetical protein [Halorubellus sp. PRR65]|uniref:hypothetical protein n=1 Tax=Halorubellus sp. PRR65 TaxID=3098148 RepID=UPI002B25A02F|nr:hypothetical protein [Halorubellus sp. PRR65]